LGEVALWLKIIPQAQPPLLDVIERLAALVPEPRFDLTRFHGVLTPNSNHRAQVWRREV
jgi:hypothetical protein